MGAVETRRRRRPRGVRRGVRAAGDQRQRPLRRRLPAVHGARPAADRPARRRGRPRARLRHDRPRLHRQGQRPGADRFDDRDARPGAARCSPRCASGAWAARRRSPTPASTGIPISGGTEKPPYSIDDNLWGRSSEGSAIEDLGAPPPDDVFQLVTPPERAPDEPESVAIGFEAGRPVSLDGERLGLVELIDRVSARRVPPRRRDRRPHRGPDRRPQGPRPLRGAGGDDHPGRAPRAREARLDDPPEQLQGEPRQPLGVPLLRRALARAAARRPRRLHGLRQRVRHRRGRR